MEQRLWTARLSGPRDAGGQVSKVVVGGLIK